MISSGPGCWRQVAWRRAGRTLPCHVRGIYLNMWNCSRWRIQSELRCRSSPEAFHWRRGWWQIVLGGRFFRGGEMFTLRLKNRFFVAFKFTFRQSLFKSLTVLQLFTLVRDQQLVTRLCFSVCLCWWTTGAKSKTLNNKKEQKVELNSRNKSPYNC